MKKILTLWICGLFFITGINISAQVKDTRQEKKEQREEKRKEEQVKLAQQNVANIESLNFTFYPSSIEPQFGVTNQLNGINNFYLTVDKTYIYLNLPYIGRFYINPVSPDNSVINITSSRFTYSIETTDNINMKVTLVPTDLASVMNQGIKFIVYLNKNTNYARLVMTADNRQEVTYTGTFS